MSEAARSAADPGAYCATTTAIAREAGVLPETVRTYADLQLIDCVRLPNGMRLFRAGCGVQVREIYEQRMARRGRRAAAT